MTPENHFRRLTSVIILSVALAFVAITISGCQGAGNVLAAILPAPPSRPQPVWHAEAGFSTKNIDKIAIIVQDLPTMRNRPALRSPGPPRTSSFRIPFVPFGGESS
jgi:hypothetical protein